MKIKSTLIATILCTLFTAVILMFGCTETNLHDTESAELNAAEITSADARAIPPVTGDPAFTWDYNDPSLEWGPCPEFFPEGCELAVIQGNPAENNADVLLRVPPNSTIDEHWHTSTERMILLAGEFSVDYEGQEPVTMLPGTYAYGPAGKPHVAHCEDAGECVLFIAFEDPVDAIPVTDTPAPGSDEDAFILSGADVEFAGCPPFMPESCGLAVLQGNPEEHNADVFFKLTPDTKVPTHWHTSAERMVLISGQMRVNYQGQPPVTVNAFDYAYGPPMLPHYTVCNDQEDDCILFIAFEEPVDAIDVRGGNLPHRR